VSEFRPGGGSILRAEKERWESLSGKSCLQRKIIPARTRHSRRRGTISGRRPNDLHPKIDRISRRGVEERDLRRLRKRGGGSRITRVRTEAEGGQDGAASASASCKASPVSLRRRGVIRAAWRETATWSTWKLRAESWKNGFMEEV